MACLRAFAKFACLALSQPAICTMNTEMIPPLLIHLHIGTVRPAVSKTVAEDHQSKPIGILNQRSGLLRGHGSDGVLRENARPARPYTSTKQHLAEGGDIARRRNSPPAGIGWRAGSSSGYLS